MLHSLVAQISEVIVGSTFDAYLEPRIQFSGIEMHWSLSWAVPAAFQMEWARDDARGSGKVSLVAPQFDGAWDSAELCEDFDPRFCESIYEARIYRCLSPSQDARAARLQHGLVYSRGSILVQSADHSCNRSLLNEKQKVGCPQCEPYRPRHP